MSTPRRAGIAVLAVLALVLAVDTAAWFWATARMAVVWEDWRAQAAAEGVQVQSAPPTRSGWPFAAALDLAAATADTGLATWSAGLVRVSLSPLHPTTLAIAVEGPQSVRLNGLPPVAVTAGALTGAVALREPGAISFEGHGISAKFGTGVLDIGDVVGRIEADGLEVALSRLSVPAAGLPFGGAIDRATARLHVTGRLGPTRAGAAPDPVAVARAWADAGGRLVVDDASVLWGKLDAQAHFTVALDSTLQPVGSGTVRMTGYHAAIDALVRAGTISANAARVVGTILDLMATSTEPAVVDVKLSLRDGLLSMGAIPLQRFPPITWP